MLRTLSILLLVPLAAALTALRVAHAEPPAPGVATYAVVVGTNTGGAGQATLRYAEDDARRVGDLLTELGGYPAASVDVVLHPTPAVLRDHLDQLAARVHADLAAGRQARVLFYYSGHARATALDLGAEEMALAELRTRLFSVPATLTVVVLDACQSGAFSRVKGAAPAADFSFNSRQHLDATGIAVLASSSGSELSQESEQLHSSYFTHHLLVGLRGAGDANRDGQVSIDEAYRYAYHQTLLDTAETAVGGQHVTFEADLKGHGEVPMSFPRAATAAIELPAALEGKTLVQDRRAHAVVAETYKAKGAAVRIAVAPGDYEVLVRHGSTLSRCQITPTPAGTLVDLEHCTTEAIVAERTKGEEVDEEEEAPLPTRWRFEVEGRGGPEHRDAYTDTLETFGYHEKGLVALAEGLRVSGWRSWKDLWFGVNVGYGRAPEWERSDADTSLRVGWSTTKVLASARLESPPFMDHGFLSRFTLYTEAGIGPALVRETFSNDVAGMTTTDNHYGLAIDSTVALHGESPLIDGLGVTIGWGFDYSYALKNDIGDRHSTGGQRLVFALSYTP